MEDNELDKILKEKLKGQITAPPELENKIKAKINEQKVLNSQSSKKIRKYRMLKPILSMAAVVLIVFAVGMGMNNDVIDEIVNSENKTTSVITSIEPTNFQSGILANDSEFIIEATDGSTVDGIKKSIYVEPALEYDIKKVGNNEYKLKFNQNIPDNTIVKLQYVKDEITQNSWAYQTSSKLSVVSVYPGNNEEDISKNTIIEVEFSYANVENFEENVSIVPNIEGNWSHFGKIWKFVPDGELEVQKYTVTVNKGVTAGEEQLKDDYNFSFTVSEDVIDDEVEYCTYSIDNISSYHDDEKVRIYFTNYSENGIDVEQVEISKFETTEDFINYLETNNSEKATNMGKYEAKVVDNDNEQYIELTKSLKNGYYVASVTNTSGRKLFECPIQINPLNAYAMETERDVLVWVANGDGLAKNVKVKYAGTEKSTDASGIANFKGIADGSEKMKYVEIGNSANSTLVVGLYNYAFDNFPNAYLYTDRLAYKNTDTIKIWGFVPTKLFYTKAEQEFYIELNDEGKQKIEVGLDGNFNYEIKLDNHADADSSIALYYKDNFLTYRAFEIKNYELQNYTYEIVADKNYALEDSNYEFDVRVKHITGFLVPNKPVVVKFNDEIYREVTSADGLAHFSVRVGTGDDSYIYMKSLQIYNGDVEEYTGADKFKDIYIIPRDVYIQAAEEEDNKFEIELYKLETDKNINISSSQVKELYAGNYDTEIVVNLVENVSERYIDYYEIDEYTNENKPVYRWNETENVTYLTTLKTKDGKASFDASKIEKKQGTENVDYTYHINFEFVDSQGREVIERRYIYSGWWRNQSLGYFYDDAGSESYDNVYRIPSKINGNFYYTYRYFLESEYGKFNVGDTKKFTLCESIEDGQKQIKNEGQILRVIFQEDITSTDIIKDNNLNYTFTSEDFPGCKMTTAYYLNGKFYRMPVYYFDFDESDRKVDIEIKTNKDEYKPGEEVTVTLKTTNNGKPIKTFVNVSVVNEAVFTLEEDMTGILERIYTDKPYPVYTYSSYMDYLSNSDGGGGGGGDPRGDFADTAHFETVYTDKNGEATVKFKFPDNVTTYRITAHAANEDMYVGEARANVVSKLDFFVQSVEPRNVKVSDDLVLNATCVATEKYDVDYEFTIKELDKTITKTGESNSIVTANFGKLPYGTYHAVIRGTYDKFEDAIEYTFKVVETTQEVKDKQELEIDAEAKISPSKNPICLEIYNKKMSQYLAYIDFIEKTSNTRLDTQIANNEIIKIKNKYYQTSNTISLIDTYNYIGTYGFKNLPGGEEDLVLTALIQYYAKDYCNVIYFDKDIKLMIREDIDLFPIYLMLSAKGEPVLNDLMHLKEVEDISERDKLLLALSFEFLGDYQTAKEVYGRINIEGDESLAAIVETFIDKASAVEKINDLMYTDPANEYLRFAILSFLKNSSEDLGKEEKVHVVCGDIDEEITLNGMQVKTYFVNNENLDDITFNTNSKDLMVAYYYQTLLENVENDEIERDIQIDIIGDLSNYSTVNLVIDFNDRKECDVRISLPNALRAAFRAYDRDYNDGYYLKRNNIDYIVVHKIKDYNHIEIPLQVIYEGEYKFESVVVQDDYTYHISNSLDLNID